MFILSKLLSAITQPIFWLALWWALALFLLLRSRRPALFMLWGGWLALVLLGFLAIPDALLRPLENRFALPAVDAVARHQGLIVLGGATGHPDSFIAHRQVPLGEAAERMTVAVELMRRFDYFSLIFSGGEGRLLTTGVTESVLAEAFFVQQGIDRDRLLLEGGARNTRENARQVARLLQDRCTAPWLLVSSASHLPRAMAEFEAEFAAIGCSLTAYPVDFRTGESTAWSDYSIARSLLRWQMALHEWLGLYIYQLTRKIGN
jgi:uncharacterized SAM-binding protein YcdF (DUF218 family)